eukprot:1658313-Rhodomonas_salina.3
MAVACVSRASCSSLQTLIAAHFSASDTGRQNAQYDSRAATSARAPPALPARCVQQTLAPTAIETAESPPLALSALFHLHPRVCSASLSDLNFVKLLSKAGVGMGKDS